MREEMETRTFGVELEFVGIPRERAIKAVRFLFRQKFSGFDCDITHLVNCYHTLYIRDPSGREWSVQRDGSVGNGGRCSCEMVTPILKGTSDILLLQEVVRAIRKAGGRVDRSCGMHIHIGGKDLTVQNLRILQNMWAAHEPIIYSGLLVDSAHRNIDYCASTNPDFLQKLNKAKPKNWLDFWNLWYDGNAYRDNQGNVDYVALRRNHYNQSRYRGLNFHSFNMRQTVEFRVFNFTRARSRRPCSSAWLWFVLPKTKRLRQLSPQP